MGLSRVVLVLALLAAMVFCAVPVREPVWDAAVYWGAGKAILSGGHVGLWEPLRPPVLPVALGVGWAVGVPALAAQWSLGMVCIIALVLLSSTLARHEGWLALALLSPLVVYSAPRGLSELPAAVLALAALVLLARERYAWSGIVAALAFLCKFPMGLAGVAIGAAILLGKGGKRFAPAAAFAGAWSIPVACYLLVNQMLYGDPLLPFTEGNKVIASAGIELYLRPWYFYLVEAMKENILWAFAPVGVLLAFLRRERVFFAASLAAVLLVGYFTAIGHKEARFLVLAVPFIALSAAYALAHVRSRAVLAAFAIVVGVQCGLGVAHYASVDGQKVAALDAAEAALPRGPLLLSNPRPIVGVDGPAGLLYYPFFDTSSLGRERERLGMYEGAILSDCDMMCVPADAGCEEEKRRFLAALESSFERTGVVESNGCVWSYHVKNVTV